MNKIRPVQLTSRDEGLLLDLYRHGVLSFAQVKARHFPQASDPTICNRLSRLNEAQLLAHQRLGAQLYQGKPERVGVVIQITRQGIQFLQARYPEEIFREDPIRLNTSTLSHDLRLVESMTALKKRFPEREQLHGKHLGGGEARAARCPDAVLRESGRPGAWALELELTAKSNRRYREIITSYRLLPRYEKVLYVVSGSPLQQKIQGHILGYWPPPGSPRADTGKFYFVTLSELLRHPYQAQISNGVSELATASEPEAVPATAQPNPREREVSV